MCYFRDYTFGKLVPGLCEGITGSEQFQQLRFFKPKVFKPKVGPQPRHPSIVASIVRVPPKGYPV